MAERIGELIAKARQTHKFTQTFVCDKVNQRLTKSGSKQVLTQATLSAWENERQRPSERNKRVLQLIWKVLEIKEDLDIAIKNTLSSEQDDFIPPDNRYINQLNAILEGRHQDTEIWLLAPEDVPALASGDLSDFWAANIMLGVDYKIVIMNGFLPKRGDLMEYNTLFHNINDTIKDLVSQNTDTEKMGAAELRKTFGSVSLYWLIGEDSTAEKQPAHTESIEEKFPLLIDSYNRISGTWENSDKNSENLLSVNIYKTSISKKLESELSRCGGVIGRIAAYLPKYHVTKPFDVHATIRTTDLAPSANWAPAVEVYWAQDTVKKYIERAILSLRLKLRNDNCYEQTVLENVT